MWLYQIPEYKNWRSIKQRCANHNRDHADRYIGRGIDICREWKNDFWSFYNHVGKKPDNSYTIDRIDNDKGYEIGNVRWATKREQASNTSRKNKNGHVGIEYRYSKLKGDRWKAKIYYNHTYINLGTYDNIDEAIMAREIAEKIFY